MFEPTVTCSFFWAYQDNSFHLMIGAGDGFNDFVYGRSFATISLPASTEQCTDMIGYSAWNCESLSLNPNIPHDLSRGLTVEWNFSCPELPNHHAISKYIRRWWYLIFVVDFWCHPTNGSPIFGSEWHVCFYFLAETKVTQFQNAICRYQKIRWLDVPMYDLLFM